MLEESYAAAERLNARRTKPLRCDIKYYFTDVKQAHTDYLRCVLEERGHQVDGSNIVVRTTAFEDALDDIIAAIQSRQPLAGRSIFLLDQCGYSDVWVAQISKIFERLATAEVILTFAADSLVNHLSDRPEYIRPVAPIALSDERVREIVALRDGIGGRALIQRALRIHLRAATGAQFDTPFFIRPQQSRRALWFLHLSRHPTARDVMIQCHWNVSNVFEHYGRGDFGMLGWDALNAGTLPIFGFEDLDAKALREQLLGSMPPRLLALASEEPVTVDAMRHMFANETAARFSDLDAVVLRLFRDKEIDVLNANGKLRSRSIGRIQPTDLIAFPRMPLIPGLLRNQLGAAKTR